MLPLLFLHRSSVAIASLFFCMGLSVVGELTATTTVAIRTHRQPRPLLFSRFSPAFVVALPPHSPHFPHSFSKTKAHDGVGLSLDGSDKKNHFFLLARRAGRCRASSSSPSSQQYSSAVHIHDASNCQPQPLFGLPLRRFTSSASAQSPHKNFASSAKCSDGTASMLLSPSSSSSSSSSAALQTGKESPSDKFSVKLISPEGEENIVEVGKDEYILDAAEDAGLELPYSCRGGSCSSCAGKLLEGSVENSEQSFLDDKQQKEGYVLLCTAYASSNCTIKTHQEELLH